MSDGWTDEEPALEKGGMPMAKRIYVADDEKNICFLIQNFLEKEGFEVRCFEDGESILAACEEQMPDLCILDVMMPGGVCPDSSGIRLPAPYAGASGARRQPG